MSDEAKKIGAKELLHEMRKTRKLPGGKDVETTREMQAAEALSRIFGLKDNPDFLWYQDACLNKAFKDARAKLTNIGTKPEDLPAAQKVYHHAHGARFWLEKQEIMYRQILNPSDPEVKVLQAAIGEAEE